LRHPLALQKCLLHLRRMRGRLLFKPLKMASRRKRTSPIVPSPMLLFPTQLGLASDTKNTNIWIWFKRSSTMASIVLTGELFPMHTADHPPAILDCKTACAASSVGGWFLKWVCMGCAAVVR